MTRICKEEHISCAERHTDSTWKMSPRGRPCSLTAAKSNQVISAKTSAHL